MADDKAVTASDFTVAVSGLPATHGTTTTTTIDVAVEVTDCVGSTDTDTLTLTFECTGA